jgi:hypothetical protein
MRRVVIACVTLPGTSVGAQTIRTVADDGLTVWHWLVVGIAALGMYAAYKSVSGEKTHKTRSILVVDDEGGSTNTHGTRQPYVTAGEAEKGNLGSNSSLRHHRKARALSWFRKTTLVLALPWAGFAQLGQMKRGMGVLEGLATFAVTAVFLTAVLGGLAFALGWLTTPHSDAEGE